VGTPVHDYVHPHDCMLIDEFALAAREKPGFTRMLELPSSTPTAATAGVRSLPPTSCTTATCPGMC
jgi:hypothetical protein